MSPCSRSEEMKEKAIGSCAYVYFRALCIACGSPKLELDLAPTGEHTVEDVRVWKLGDMRGGHGVEV